MKRILLGGFVVAAVLVAMPMFAAFEAHVVNVTATIENALNVPIKELNFGTVFPQEALDQTFNVSLSNSFLATERVDDIDYFIRQKPKCWNGDMQNPLFGQVKETTQNPDEFVCADAGYTMLPLLCPYLSKTEQSTDGIASGGENDGDGISAFHGPLALEDWDLSTAKSYDVFGHLAKSQQDTTDTWNIDLKVPCFAGECAQDWPSFVKRYAPGVNPADYIQPAENKSKLFGCDLWLEVKGISLPGFCQDKLDLMLVLDRSGSIDSGELTSLKSAANAFVTAVAPSASGTHVGEVSFNDSASLDVHLTDVEADVHTAINALASGGLTNLAGAINVAAAEQDNLHFHERADVKDVMIIITDGNPTSPDAVTGRANAIAAADAARAAGIEVFVLGIGADLDDDFLKNEIADDDSHYFAVANYADLQTVLLNIGKCNSNGKIIVRQNDLEPGPTATALTNGSGKWFMYNDSTDVIDNTLGSFVAGPSTPAYGAGSLAFTLGANPLDRKNIATFQFSGVTLASITQMSFGAYSHSGVSGPNESPYLNFNVDFNGTGTWQRRLVYVPSVNGAVPQDSWNSYDVVNGGTALWTWSGYTDNGNQWPDSNPNQYRTWNDIKVAFPGVRLLPIGGWLGVRVGEPGPSGYTGNVDFFKIATSGPATVYDFEN